MKRPFLQGFVGLLAAAMLAAGCGGTVVGPQKQQSPVTTNTDVSAEPKGDVAGALSEIAGLAVAMEASDQSSASRLAAWDSLRAKVAAALEQPGVLAMPAADLDKRWNPENRRWIATFEDTATGVKVIALDPHPSLMPPLRGDDVLVAWSDGRSPRVQKLFTDAPYFLSGPRVSSMQVVQDGSAKVLALLGSDGNGAHLLTTFDLKGGSWTPSRRIGAVKSRGYLQAQTPESGTSLTVRIEEAVRKLRFSGSTFIDSDKAEFCEGPRDAYLNGWNCLIMQWQAGAYEQAQWKVATDKRVPPTWIDPDAKKAPPGPELSSQAVSQLAAGLPGGQPRSVTLLWAEGGEGMAVTDGGLRFAFRRTGQTWSLSDWETAPGVWARGNPLALSNRDAMIAGITLGSTESAVMIALGLPDGREPSGLGEFWYYRDLGLTLAFNLDEGRVKEMRLAAGSGTTRRGLKVGDPAARVVQLYGEPDRSLQQFGFVDVKSASQAYQVRARGLKEITGIEIGNFTSR